MPNRTAEMRPFSPLLEDFGRSDATRVVGERPSRFLEMLHVLCLLRYCPCISLYVEVWYCSPFLDLDVGIFLLIYGCQWNGMDSRISTRERQPASESLMLLGMKTL